MTDEQRLDLPQGTLDLLILKALSLAAAARLGHLRAHPPCVARHAPDPAGLALPRPAPAGAARLDQGHWDTSDNNRRAKYYELTRSGQAA